MDTSQFVGELAPKMVDALLWVGKHDYVENVLGAIATLVYQEPALLNHFIETDTRLDLKTNLK